MLNSLKHFSAQLPFVIMIIILGCSSKATNPEPVHNPTEETKNKDAKKAIYIEETDPTGLNIIIPFGRKLREPTPLKDMLNFVNTTAFSAKHHPNIYMIFNDTWRRDHLTPELMPNVFKFHNEAVYPRNAISAATATYHSTFSILNALPSYLSYPFIRRHVAEMGAMPLHILIKKLGYQFHLDTWGNEIDCLQEILKVDESSNFMNYRYAYQANYGFHMNLINECKNSTTLGNQNVVHKKLDSKSTYNSYSEMDIAVLNSALKRTQHNTSGHHIYYIHTMGMHDPYSWRPDQTNLFVPNLFEEKSDISDVLANSYKNAAMSFDKSFGEFIAALKAANKYDDALIVLFGDHGEALGEKIGEKRVWFHGFRPFHNRISIPWMMKFPGDNTAHKKDLEDATVSGYDIMPTILDYLGLENYGQEFYFGKSLFSKEIQSPERNIISVRPNNISADTFEMALINSTYKVIVRLQKGEDLDMLKADEVRIVAITDLYDNPIEHSEKFAKFELAKDRPVKFYDEFVEIIKKDFADSLNYMFPAAQ